VNTSAMTANFRMHHILQETEPADETNP